MRAFLGLGSNIGDRRQFLRDAVGAMPDVVAVSPVYETDPVGGPAQDDFYNIVVEVDTLLSPRELLARCQELERAADRRRVIHWGPRTLDVDVVWIEGHEIDDEDYQVPHPRAHERNFVMVPLLAIDPSFELPGYDPEQAIGVVRPIGPL